MAKCMCSVHGLSEASHACVLVSGIDKEEVQVGQGEQHAGGMKRMQLDGALVPHGKSHDGTPLL